MNKEAMPYIQNHVNWSWATAAKIVGLQYCHRNHLPVCLAAPISHSVIRADQTGLRPQACGESDGWLTVDAAQLVIVEHAKDINKNPEGNLPEGDEGKARALRCVITGDPDSAIPEIVSSGYNRAVQDMLITSANQIREAMEYGNYFIGNYRMQNGIFHSVVLCPTSGFQIELYDPWDGYKDRYTVNQIFRGGFLTNRGPGVIRWIQYIR
ncbi:hypothetical protein [Lacrimispora sp.]|jgi:hypothetical protein|uniref:hypothetical protein n=1 Tax=Lacrimispora sp. TaxID=2719234 RepID=UPI0026A4530D|nr:hypothetical protein [Lacrimispora sp.]